MVIKGVTRRFPGFNAFCATLAWRCAAEGTEDIAKRAAAVGSEKPMEDHRGITASHRSNIGFDLQGWSELTGGSSEILETIGITDPRIALEYLWFAHQACRVHAKML
jgi:hypothetical protein